MIESHWTFNRASAFEMRSNLGNPIKRIFQECYWSWGSTTRVTGAGARLRTRARGSIVFNSTAESGRLNQSIAVGDRDRNNLLNFYKALRPWGF